MPIIACKKSATMINLKFYLDKRHLKGDESRPASVKVLVTRNRTTALISTGVSVLPLQWDSSKLTIVNHPNEKRLNLHLSKFLISIQNIVLDMEENGLAVGMNAKDVKDFILSRISPKEESSDDIFIVWYNKFIELKDNERTKQIYTATLARIKEFESNLDSITFEKIDLSWLRSFEKFLTKTSRSANSRAIHFRNIRAVFNFAMSEEVTSNYPFRKFKIKYQPTFKRSFTTEQLRLLFNHRPSKYTREGKDLFMLTFFLCGINFYDLTNLTKENIRNGRIEYIRAKTKKFYSIKLIPEALEIIERNKGVDYLINIKDRFTVHHNAISAINDKIKALVEECVESGHDFPTPSKVSTYWARHSWATTAAELDIPKETIAAGLGHSIGSPITSIYIDFNLKKVDEANKRIVDYILYNKV